MKTSIRAIETEFLGYRFRSRLEARWAHVFNGLGLSFVYEPEGFEFEEEGRVSRYLPDFSVATWQSWVEIKPDSPSEDERTLARLLAEGTGSPVAVFCGVPGNHAIETFLPSMMFEHTAGCWVKKCDLTSCSWCMGTTSCSWCMGTNLSIWWDGRWLSKRECLCGKGTPLAFSSPRLRRAYEKARSCRFERLPRNLRRALEGV